MIYQGLDKSKYIETYFFEIGSYSLSPYQAYLVQTKLSATLN